MRKLLMTGAMMASKASAGTVHAAATQVNFGFVPIGNDYLCTGGTLGSSTSLIFSPNMTFTTNTVGQTGSVCGRFRCIFRDGRWPICTDIRLYDRIDHSFRFGQDLHDGRRRCRRFTGRLYGDLYVRAGQGCKRPELRVPDVLGTIVGPDSFSAHDVQLVNCNQSGGPMLR